MVTPAGPGTGLVLVQPNFALLGLEFGLDAPAGPSQVSQRLQGIVLEWVGQVVTGFAAVQVRRWTAQTTSSGLRFRISLTQWTLDWQIRGSWVPSAAVISRQASSQAIHRRATLRSGAARATACACGPPLTLTCRIRPDGSSGRTLECGLRTQKGRAGNSSAIAMVSGYV